MPKLNIYRKNGALLETLDGVSGDVTGLGYSTEYSSGDFLVQWESDDGKVSNQVSIDTGFTTGAADTTTVVPTTEAPTTETPTTASNNN